jgi:hypothetical protein
LKWKIRDDGHLFVARASHVSGGMYFIRQQDDGYKVEFHTTKTVSDVSTRNLRSLVEARELVELHHEKRRELIIKYVSKHNIPREAWEQFRCELLAWQEASLGENDTVRVPDCRARGGQARPQQQSLDEALAVVRAAGYRVSKPRMKRQPALKPTLNAIGKPYSPQYDPKYRLKYKLSTGHLRAPYNGPFVADPDWQRVMDKMLKLKQAEHEKEK